MNKLLCICLFLSFAIPVTSQKKPMRQMEYLTRGVVAVIQGEGKVFVGWRMLGTDPDDIAFNLYRRTAGSKPVKLNDVPIADVTFFIDDKADLTK